MNILKQIHHTRSRLFLHSFTLCLTLGLLSLLSLATTASLSAATIDDLIFTLINNDTEYSVAPTKPLNIQGTLTIPATYNGKPVTQIVDSAFDGSIFMTSITVPESITVIGKSAFQGCDRLTSVDLSQTKLTSIEQNTFASCSELTSITLPPTLTSIGAEAFRSCIQLTSLSIPQSVTSIGAKAFHHCFALTSVNLPPNLTSIEENTFNSCSSLTSITTVPQSVTSIGLYAFYGCSSLTSIDLSQTTITKISRSAFSGCTALTSITIPQSVTSIHEAAFRNCSALTSIDLSQTAVTSIDNSAFRNCSALTSISLPKTLTSIGDFVFNECHQLGSVVLLGSAPTLGTDTFFNAGRNAGGSPTFTIYKDHEASYYAWGNTGYTYNVVPGPSTSGPVVLVLSTSYNPTSKALSIITKNEPTTQTLNLQHTASLGGTWTNLGALDFTKANNSATGATTRTVTLNPATKPTGFYRIVSAPTNP